MDHVEDVERLFSWLKAPMVNYREFAPQREIADAVASWPAVHRAAVDAGAAAADTPAPQGDAAAKERIARESRPLPQPPPVMSAGASPEPSAADAGLPGTLGERPQPVQPEPAERADAAEEPAPEPTIAGFEETPATPPRGAEPREAPAYYPAAERGALFAGEYGGRDRDDRPRSRVADRHDRSLDAVFSRLSGGRDRLPDPRARARTSPGLGSVFGRLR